MNELKKIDIAFIILNYNTNSETENLIKSIKKNIETKFYTIVVVDNCSKKNMGQDLKNEYINDNNIHVILLDENQGFARGNNIGISWLRQKFFVKYICCLNSDTILRDSNFYSSLDSEFNRSQAAIIGPKIILKDGSIQETAYKLHNIQFYKNELEYNINLINGVVGVNSDSIKQNIKNKMSYLKRFIHLLRRKKVDIRLKFTQNDKVLHGCCLIFTPTFFQQLQGFDARTFLYREEELLYIAIKRQGLHSLYTPRLSIVHLEDAATNTIVNTTEEKKRFVAKNQVESLKILIKEMETAI